ncbi:MAG: carbohydrate porin [Asticcacaulis sp.]
MKTRHKRHLRAMTAAGTGLLCALSLSAHAETADGAGEAAQAQTQTVAAPATVPNAFDGKTLLGDMGFRSDWAARGITVKGDYVGELMQVTSGGLEQSASYIHQMRVTVDFDMKKLAGWDSGGFHFLLNDRRGETTTTLDHVGNRLFIQEAAGGTYSRIVEASFDYTLKNGTTYLKAGYYPMGNGYAVQALGTTFVNAAFCAHPLSLSGNSGWYNYPNARWGAEVMQTVTPELKIRTGVFQVNPELGRKENAYNPFGGDTTGYLYPIEFTWTPFSKTAYPGNHKFGAYYEDSTASRRGEAGTEDRRFGYWYMGEQKIFAEKANPKRGLTVFAQYLTHDKETSQIWKWYGLGGVYQGTFKGRDNDKVSVGWIKADINERMVAQQRQALITNGVPLSDPRYKLSMAEELWEVSYSYQVNPWLIIRPDIQYIKNPGTYSFRQTKDATVIGIQVRAAL